MTSPECRSASGCAPDMAVVLLPRLDGSLVSAEATVPYEVLEAGRYPMHYGATSNITRIDRSAASCGRHVDQRVP